MKNFKIIASLLCLFVCSAFVSCDGNSENPEDDTTDVVVEKSYNATVKYTDGTAVPNVRIQWCNSVTCFQPVTTDENGVAKNTKLADGNYGVHIMENDIPEGYTYDPNGHDVTTDNRDVEITLVPVTAYASGDGSTASPYVITEGYYVANVAQVNQMLYYSLTATEAGTYQIRSLALEKFATNPMSILVHYNNTQYGSATQTNFDQEVTLTAGQTLNLIMMIAPSNANNTAYPAEFSFQVTKK